MSQFLGAESFVISLGASVQTVQDTFKTAITAYGWRCIHEAVVPTAVLGTMTSAANAFDLNLANVAGNNAAVPVWVGCQLATPFTPTAMYLHAGEVNVQSQTDNTPRTYSLDYADAAGGPWTAHQTWTNEDRWFIGERRKYVVTGAPAKNFWRLNITAKSATTYCYINQWALENSTGQVVSNQNYLDLIPPVDQTIGDAYSREVVRLMFSGSSIMMAPVQELLQGNGQQIIFGPGTAGTAVNSITINGITVSYTGASAGATANDNLRGLYDAVKASVDANFTDWTWTWMGYIHGMRTTVAKNLTPTTVGVTINYTGSSNAPQTQTAGLAPYQSLTTDLVNGFVYYLQVNKRGLALATKTNAGYYGPLHACYGDNATAVAQLPVSDYGMPCTIMELVVGYDDVEANTGAYGRFSHYWGGANTAVYDGGYCDYNANYACNAWSKQRLGYLLQDWSNNFGADLAGAWIVLRGEGLFTGADSGAAWSVHRMACDPDTSYKYFQGGGYQYQMRVCGPVFSGLDWYRYTGALTNEQMVLAAHTDFETQLTANLLASDTSIEVTSTAGFASAGWISIQGEIIQYTSKDATHFLGCTRAKYATLAYKQYAGQLVSVVGWYVKINTGLIFWGFQKPV